MGSPTTSRRQHPESTLHNPFAESQSSLDFDICARKHKGNAESVAANPSPSHKSRDRQRIYELAILRGDSGLTLKEVVSTLGIQIQSASARISELKADGRLVATGNRREHCAVLVPAYASTEEKQ